MFMRHILPAVAALGLLVSAATADAATVSFERTSSDPIRVGDTVSFALKTGDDFPSFAGFQAQVNLDAAFLSLVDIDYSADLPFFPTPVGGRPEALGADGRTTITAIGALNLGGVSGDFTLATFDFTALAAGTTTFELQPFNNRFITGSASPIFDGGFSRTVTIVADDTVAPPAVPLPASALLLLGGMGGLAAMRRRQKA